ncbi:MAG: excinuclease ABC subunit UvrA [Eubacteriales bacterium]
MKDYISIKGARVNNLKNIDVDIPRNKLVVLTGLSGSGKSSLAFDTIYAEGQRRYVESLSSYARQFLGQMDKPDVDNIEGLSPAISIDQKTTNKNPRSTVGTVTEIYDYMRLLYTRVGQPHCPKCGKPIKRQTVDQIVDNIMTNMPGKRIMIAAPVVRGRKGEYKKELKSYERQGYVRVIVDGINYTLDEDIVLDKNKKHSIDIVVDRIEVKDEIAGRLFESAETTLELSGGLLKVIDAASGEEHMFSKNFACIDCGISLPEIEPRMFSFNNPYGACPNCHGLGIIMQIDEDSVISDKNKSLSEGAIRISGFNSANEESFGANYFRAMAEKYNFSLDTPYKDLPEDVRHMLLYGNNGEKLKIRYSSSRGSGVFLSSFEGIINNLERRYKETTSDMMKEEIESYMNEIVCPVCNGDRLNKEVLSVKIGGKNIAQVSSMPIDDISEFLYKVKFNETQQIIAKSILKEIQERLKFLSDVGLNYLTLSRAMGTVSGGEAQRIRLATQIGSGLMGVLYILDEPSIGLHQKDNQKLLATLKRLRDLGNTLIVVEHDEETMLEADYIIDIGPRAGISGGYVVAAGTPDEIKKSKDSITGQYLSGKKSIPLPKKRRESKGEITVVGAKQNNLKNLNVKFPLGVMTVVTGVSGSGKSTLVNEILLKACLKEKGFKERPGEYKRIDGIENIDKVVAIDQAPIGRTPRSNPATYTGLFTAIREIFAMTPDAKVHGYTPGRFSFNVKGGRCENCRGDGIIKIEMHFLPDVYVNCEVCGGKRYNKETLNVYLKGKNIHDVLEMTVDEAYEFFKNIPIIESKLKLLKDVGLGYIKLGQPSTTLSGGEAQRVKLATHLSKRQTGNTLFILDEPTTGLHIYDVKKLIGILNRLVDKGNTVIVIEHNLDVIKSGDYIIDLGQDGGNKGGEVIATGTPEEVSKVENSYTGQYLKKIFEPK